MTDASKEGAIICPVISLLRKTMLANNSALKKLESTLNDIIVGKKTQIRMALCCLFAQGHLLLEDLPGTGKTTLAKSLSILMGLDNQRVQFTADLLPADILGSVVYHPETQSLQLQKGPVFTHILLADEINRASPKCQSALLEAMEEQQISIERETLALESPFFVIATQNPLEQYGTFPLPESQLDRFLFCISMGYMEKEAETLVLQQSSRRNLLANMQPIMDKASVLATQEAISKVHVSEAVAVYIQALLHETRHCGKFVHGLSTRSGLALVRAAQAYAFFEGKDAIYPEHVQMVFPYVASHRLKAKGEIVADHQELVMSVLTHVTLHL